MCYRNYYNQPGAWREGGRGYYARKFGKDFRSVPVNITEKDDRFELSLYAPALVKSAIQISAKDDILTISYQAPASSQEDAENYTRREYRFDSFERSFLLNGKVKTDSISAIYQEGILTVLLPKNPDTNRPAQDIKVT
jgi:HSP20 family protein